MMVLWGCMLMTVMAASFAYSMRVETTIAENFLQRAKARGLAEAGVRRGILALLEPDTGSAWQPDGSLHEQRFGKGTMSIRISSENGKIDLNAAPDELIYGLFDSLAETMPEMSPANARQLAETIIDWRESDGRTRLRGPRGAMITTENARASRRNGAFLSVSELLHIPGMEPEILAAVESSLTVFSQTPKIDPASASRQVLLAMPGLQAGQVQEFLWMREQYNEAGAQPGRQKRRLPIELLSPASRYLSRARASVYTVEAEGRMPGGVEVGRKAVVRLTGKRSRPYSILAWIDVPSDTKPGDDVCCETPAISRIAGNDGE